MIPPHNKMIGSVVAPDKSMPQSLARSCQAHSQRQQRQQHIPCVVIAFRQSLVSPHARIMIHVAWFGHADHRMQEQYRINFSHRTLAQFFVRPVQGVSRLEGDHIEPSQLLKP